MGVTTRLAEAVVESDFHSLSSVVVARSIEMMLNAAGVGIAGSRTREGRIVAEFALETAGSGPSTLLGTRGRTSIVNASLANGTMVHALDFDEAILRRSNHPSNAIFPAVMALGEKLGASGQHVLAAFALGCEVSTKIGAAGDLDELIPRLARNGWHLEGVAGAIGAAAAAAKLMRLDVEQTTCALGIATSQASGVQVNYGTSTKSFHCGQAAMHGVIAASLASKGFTSSRHAIEDVNGFFGCYRRDTEVDEAELMGRFANPFDVESPGVALKLYPCASATHSCIDAIRFLVLEHEIRPDQVARVHVSCPPRAGNDLKSFTRPSTGLEGKFSLNYCAAVAIVYGIPRMHHFTEAAITDQQLVGLLDKIELERNEKPTLEISRPATVTITLTDGRSLRHRVEHAKGHPKFPLTKEELNDKFRYCTSEVLPLDITETAIDMFRSLPTIADTSRLFRILALQEAAV